MSEKRLSLNEAHDLIAAALVRSRTSAENAASVATALVAAEAAGQSGHGRMAKRQAPTIAPQRLPGGQFRRTWVPAWR